MEDLNEYKDSLKKMSIKDLITEMDQLRTFKDEASNTSKHYNKMWDILRLHVLPEKMEDEDVSNITIEGVGRANLQSDIYFSIPKDNKLEAFDWLRDNGHEDLITETVNSSSGKAWAKECLRDGIQLPEDIFKITPYTMAKLTRTR